MIAIVDVCSGNLRSVERALAHAGADVIVTRDPEVVRRADKLVVPGQGAFGVFMRGLTERGLGEVLREYLRGGRPYLGICLGMQVLFEHSEEGDCAGLGLLGGRVIRVEPGDHRLKVPHMGWNRVAKRKDDVLFAGIADGAHMYFVHSYRAVPTDASLVALEAVHGVPVCAAIRKDNVFACQFHPEKSQAIGLRLLRNFVEAA
ncbi:MAG: imidazole glycerol phosphate synthase, glutamine amidotransferase subunit [Myxococcales bacterium]|nr:imidazole glycerol phosphate synthase, glutamine amidotransferase subunit [Myxococcales bacterium]